MMGTDKWLVDNADNRVIVHGNRYFSAAEALSAAAIRWDTKGRRELWI